MNDAWLFSGQEAAFAATTALETTANAALPTDSALAMLDNVADSHSADCIRIHGTYPHAAWQGSRLEGFVIAQGAPVDNRTTSQLQSLASSLQRRAIPFPTHGAPSLKQAPTRVLYCGTSR